jgi:mono/diheme cytochrome c family protein
MRTGTIALALTGAILAGCAQNNTAPPVITEPPKPPVETGLVYLDQGWQSGQRDAFYAGPQGSEVMLLSWVRALKQADGAPFLAGNLGRYGYLPNPDSAAGLPVGFTAAGAPGSEQFGMTCAACHTREIDVAGRPYRIDGGPAIVDFQPFLEDLNAAVKRALASPAAFKDFADAVLGDGAKPAAVAKLHKDLKAWELRFDTLVRKALPQPAWGPSRLDAVGMIFDRLTGLDIGTSSDYLIPANIKKADAPVRYPFLWNAPIQDRTQWPGFAENGSDILGLARNLGEVYGVFATFHPKKNFLNILFGANFIKNNSADFKGLGALEDLIKKLSPPKWPWALDPALVAEGKAIYERKDNDGCVSCHAVPPNVPAGATRFPNQQTWETKILNVDTDTREYDILNWKAETGVLKGTGIPFVVTLKPVDTAFNILSVSVLGSIVQHYLPITSNFMVQSGGAKAKRDAGEDKSGFTPDEVDLKQAFQTPGKTAEAPKYAYESRVLQGIWAAAPYLHNGSVPSLAELLKRPEDRVASFKVGPAYDIDNVGLAAVQTKFDYVLTTTGCDQKNSGNSRCGHDYGTKLSEKEKRALLEYLKSL